MRAVVADSQVDVVNVVLFGLGHHRRTEQYAYRAQRGGVIASFSDQVLELLNFVESPHGKHHK